MRSLIYYVEIVLNHIRKLKLLIFLLAFIFGWIAYALLKLAILINDLLLDFTNYIEAAQKVPFLIFFEILSIGVVVCLVRNKHPTGSFGDRLWGYVGVGVISVILPYVVIAVVQSLIQKFLVPAFNEVAAFLMGTALISIKTVLRILLSIYLTSFLFDLFILNPDSKTSPTEAIKSVIKKYWKELIDILSYIYENLINIFKSK